MSRHRPTALLAALLAVLIMVLVVDVALAAEPSPRPPPPCEIGTADGAKNMKVEPQVIPIGLFYGGADVTVSADLPSDMPAAFLLEGERAPMSLKKKGKVWGVLWMNVGDLEIEKIPSVYLLATTAPLQGLANQAVLDQSGLGYHALVRGSGADEPVFDEVVKLEESEGLFSVREGAIHRNKGADGSVHLSASLPISARVPTGKYTIRLIAFDSGSPRCLGSTTLTLEQTGTARSLRTLAFDHGLLYGITAVVVALIAGIATGLIFGRNASKGH